MYKEKKASQIAAFFVSKEGGKIAHLKLIKLMYIADRKSLSNCGFPMTYDKMKSLPHGPVLDKTVNYIGSSSIPMPESWKHSLSKDCPYTLSLNDQLDVSELSDSDLEILDEVYNEYGFMSKYELRDHTHDDRFFPEWQNPNGSSLPIEYEDIFLALGNSQQVAEIKANEIRAIEAIDNIFESL